LARNGSIWTINGNAHVIATFNIGDIAAGAARFASASG
jgi:hypothetical protein